VTRPLQRLQRRALVVLTWLMLALCVVPAAEAQSGRAHAVLVAAVLGGGAAPVRTAPVAGSAAVRSAVGARPERVVVESALVAAREAERSAARAASSSAPPRPRPRDGRHLYLESSRFLC
jgi:hypothetical protein